MICPECMSEAIAHNKDAEPPFRCLKCHEHFVSPSCPVPHSDYWSLENKLAAANERAEDFKKLLDEAIQKNTTACARIAELELELRVDRRTIAHQRKLATAAESLVEELVECVTEMLRCAGPEKRGAICCQCQEMCDAVLAKAERPADGGKGGE